MAPPLTVSDTHQPLTEWDTTLYNYTGCGHDNHSSVDVVTVSVRLTQHSPYTTPTLAQHNATRSSPPVHAVAEPPDCHSPAITRLLAILAIDCTCSGRWY